MNCLHMWALPPSSGNTNRAKSFYNYKESKTTPQLPKFIDYYWKPHFNKSPDKKCILSWIFDIQSKKEILFCTWTMTFLLLFSVFNLHVCRITYIADITVLWNKFTFFLLNFTYTGLKDGGCCLVSVFVPPHLFYAELVMQHNASYSSLSRCSFFLGCSLSIMGP